MKNFALFFLLCLGGVDAHGRLTNVGGGTTRIGSATRYEDSPVAGGNRGQAWICRHATKKASQATLTPNGKLALRWKFGAAHVGDCAVYLSYDVDKQRSEQGWFKIANLYDCKAKNKQNVNIDIPPWLPAGPAVLRWDWYAIHVWPKVEFYSQCSDVTVANNGQTPIMPKTYKVNTNAAYPPSGKSGKGYRNAFNPGGDQSMTGPSCANGYTKNDCARTAVGTKRNTIDGGGSAPPSGGGGGGVTTKPPAPVTTPAPVTKPPVTTPAVAPKPKCPSHVIASGTTLGSIAASYTAKGMPITWQEICKFNAIENCDSIMAGEVIIIPVGVCKGAKVGGVTAAVPVTAAPTKPSGGAATKPSGGAATKPSGGAATKPSGGEATKVEDSSVVATVGVFVGSAALIQMVL